MPNLTINNGGIITNAKNLPNIDLRYGPYESLEEAYNELSDQITLGLVVGIKSGSNITEYIANDNNLFVPRSVSISYEDLDDLPKINNITLTGNKNTSDLGISYNDLNNKPTFKTINNESIIGSGDIEIEPHFKGWFDSLTSLQTNYSSPEVGDYGYVKGATTSDPVKIYECTTVGTWSDSGREFNSANDQSFESGESVNSVSIINDLTTGGEHDVLSAEVGKELGEELKKEHIYISTPNRYEDDIAEFYFISQNINNEPNVFLKCYNNLVYTGFQNNSVLARYGITNAVNNVIYPITVYNSQNDNYPTNSVFGYIIFKNIEHFRNNPTPKITDLVNKEFCSILSNQPIIDTNLQYIASINGDIASINVNLEPIQGVINKNFLKEYTIADFVNGYTATQNKNIGDVISKVSTSNPYTSDSAAGQLVISVKAGDKVKLRFRDRSNLYCRNWILTDSTYHILSWAVNEIYNYIDNAPLVLTVESDGYLFVQITQAYYQYNSAGLKVDTYMTIEESVSDIIEETIEDLDIVEKVVVCVPDEICAVVGDTLQLYYRSIFRVVDYSKYDVNITCSVGSQYPRYYEITPIASQIGDYNIRFRIYDNNHKLLGEKSSTLKIRQKVNSPSSELNVLCVGASATANGQWASEFKRRLVGTGGLPVGSEVSNVVFVGRMDRTFEGKQVNLEATGGYSFNSYNSTNTARYRFNVATFEGLLINVDDVYSNNGHNFTIKEIHSTDNYFSCEGDGTPETASTSNPKTLTKVSGTGSETISYTSTSFSGNPFVYNGAINIQQYADDYCNPQQASHGRIDVVYTELFGNGTPSYGENMSERMASMQTFINNISAVFPNCKFCIGLFWNPDIKGGMGVNYGATGALSDPYAIKYTNMNMCNELQEYINSNNLGDRVYILNWLNEFDEENDMMQTTKPVNPRSLVTEIFGVNGVHPATVGYNQMADSCWRLFINKFCQ